jgi:uncharacterized protein (DUF433 family)
LVKYLGKFNELSENENMRDYVSKIEDVYRVANSRVSLDSIVYEFQRGASPESIQRSFSPLTLEEVYGAIAFYLANHKEVHDYLKKGEKEFENLQNQSRNENRTWYEQLQKAREETLIS